jgi:hypothetical protein
VWRDSGKEKRDIEGAIVEGVEEFKELGDAVGVGGGAPEVGIPSGGGVLLEEFGLSDVVTEPVGDPRVELRWGGSVGKDEFEVEEQQGITDPSPVQDRVGEGSPGMSRVNFREVGGSGRVHRRARSRARIEGSNRYERQGRNPRRYEAGTVWSG